jgi:hypothetical protein
LQNNKQAPSLGFFYWENNMSLMPMNQGIYGQPVNDSNVLMQDISSQRRLAEQLRQQGSQELQGQMISGHYVAPSWSQGLAKVLQQGLGAKLEGDAQKKEKDYNNEKNRKLAEFLAGNKAQTVQQGTTETSTMPAYTPEQQDQFGSPLPNVQRQPVITQTPNMVTETPDQVQERQRMAGYQLASQYQGDPAITMALGDLNHQRDRGERQLDIADQRGYEGGVRKEERQFKVEDRDANQEFQRIQQKEQFGQQLTMQEKQFAQAWKLQGSQQRFQTGIEKMKLAAQEADTPQLGDDALSAAAQRYRQTGIIPPLGQGKAASALRSSIINRASVLDKAEGIDAKTSTNNIITGAADANAVKRATADFSVGKNGNTVRSLNVAVSHLDTLERLGTELGNGNMQMVNKIGNEFAKQTGKTAPTNFDAAKQIVADEVVKAVVGAGGALADREEAARTINAAQSPAQLTSAIRTYKELMGGQLKGLKNQYEQSTGRKDFERLLNPETIGELNGGNAHPDDINALLNKYGTK